MQSGLVSITNVPGSNAKEIALSSLHDCALQSESAVSHVFPDGTHRRTLATHEVKGIRHSIRVSNDKMDDHCKFFVEASEDFRETVSKLTSAFTQTLDHALSLPSPHGTSLLATEAGYEYKTISDLVGHGEHLEHFHSYQKFTNSDATDQQTIEWHIDQGLFLVFTPGRMIHEFTKTGASPEITKGFFIQHRDGSTAEVVLESQDDFIIMLGDGVNQYLNLGFSAGPHDTLRAVPHYLHLRDFEELSQARVWYGRMVLPPAESLHPQHGVTFSSLRKTLIGSSLTESSHESDSSALSLGCSGHMVARELAETTCEAGSIYCWHRCMNTTEFGASEEVCASQNLQVQCINPRGQLWDNTHGDFYPGCADNETTPIASPYPPIPDLPREESTCSSSEAFRAFSKTSEYEHAVDLQNNATFAWNVKDNTIEGRISFNGLFGWLAIGFAGPGGRNGMYGVS